MLRGEGGEVAGSRPEGLGQREAVSWGRKGAGEKSNSAGE